MYQEEKLSCAILAVEDDNCNATQCNYWLLSQLGLALMMKRLFQTVWGDIEDLLCLFLEMSNFDLAKINLSEDRTFLFIWNAFRKVLFILFGTLFYPSKWKGNQSRKKISDFSVPLRLDLLRAVSLIPSQLEWKFMQIPRQTKMLSFL